MANINRDERKWDETVSDHERQIMMTYNVYNAYLLSKYKQENKIKWQDTPRFMKSYLVILTYFIVFVQWAAHVVIVIAQYDKGYHLGSKFFDEFHILPDEHWQIKLSIWPFFFIALCYTNTRYFRCEMDLKAFKNKDIIVFGTQWNLELLIMKHITEGILSRFGSIVFYTVLAGGAVFTNWGDFMGLIFPMISYQFVYQLDEHVYQLVKDLFVVQYSDENKDKIEKENDSFVGTHNYSIFGMKQAPLRLLSVFFQSLYVLGIFIKSYLVFVVFGLFWLMTMCAECGVGKQTDENPNDETQPSEVEAFMPIES